MSAEKKGDEYRARGRHRNAAEGKTDGEQEREKERKMQHRIEKTGDRMEEGGQMQHMGGEKRCSRKEECFLSDCGRQTNSLRE